MADNCGQQAIRKRLEDATREELLEIIIQRDGQADGRFDWWEQYKAAEHRMRRLEQVLAIRYHNEHELNRALHVADLEAKNRRLRHEIRLMQLAAERRNSQCHGTEKFS